MSCHVTISRAYSSPFRQVKGVNVLNCCYAHHADRIGFHRRAYWLLESTGAESTSPTSTSSAQNVNSDVSGDACDVGGLNSCRVMAIHVPHGDVELIVCCACMFMLPDRARALLPRQIHAFPRQRW